MVKRPWDELKDLRISKGWTQAELANGVVSQSMVSHIEAGRIFPSDKTLSFIAKRLGVDPLQWIATWGVFKSRYALRGMLWAAFLVENVAEIRDLTESSGDLLTPFEQAIYLAYTLAQGGSLMLAESQLQTAWMVRSDETAMTHTDLTRICVIEAQTHVEIFRKTCRVHAATWWASFAVARLLALQKHAHSV